MAKNLDVNCYRNGDTIPQVQNAREWKKLTTGAWCYYSNDDENGPVFGKLYNWYAVNDPRGLAPEGWHIPTDGDWAILIDFLGGEKVAGGKLKETGTMFWEKSKEDATNKSGFTALPNGIRSDFGIFYNLCTMSTFWSASQRSINFQAWGRTIECKSGKIFRRKYIKTEGLGVRLICSGDSCLPYSYSVNEPPKNNEIKKNETVQIGKQTWMKYNLDVESYSNGDPIPQVQDPRAWEKLTTGAWCYSLYRYKKGIQISKLYNWYAVTDPRGIGPIGFRIPDLSDWTYMFDFLIDERVNDKKINRAQKNFMDSLMITSKRSSRPGRKSDSQLPGFWIFSEISPGQAFSITPRYKYKQSARIETEYKAPIYRVRCISMQNNIQKDDTLTNISTDSQNQIITTSKEHDARFIYFGFYLGAHVNFLIIRPIDNLSTQIFLSTSLPDIYPSPDAARILSIGSLPIIGFLNGLSVNLRMNKNFDLRFIPALVFGANKITYKLELYYLDPLTIKIDTLELETTKSIGSTYIHFPLELKFKFIRSKKIQLYLIAGIQYTIDLASYRKENFNKSDQSTVKFNSSNLYVNAGLGLSIYSRWLKVSMELKNMYGFFDVLKKDGTIYTEGIQSIKSNIVQFAFSFE